MVIHLSPILLFSALGQSRIVSPELRHDVADFPGATVSIVSMGGKFRAVPLIHTPNWYLITAVLLLLPVGIFAIILAVNRWQVEGTHGLLPEVSIIHVERFRTTSRQTGIFAMRDGVFYRTITSVGFLSLSSKCRQRRGDLPPQLSLAQVTAIVASPEFQAIRNTPPSARRTTPQSWYARVRVRNTYRCAALSDEDARANPAFQRLLAWFNAVDGAPAGELGREYDCSEGTGNYSELSNLSGCAPEQ